MRGIYRKTLIKSMSLLMVLCLILSGCMSKQTTKEGTDRETSLFPGENVQGETVDESGLQYELKSDVPLNLNVQEKNSFRQFDSFLYYIDYQDGAPGQMIRRIHLKTGETAVWITGEDCYFLCFCFSEEGNLMALQRRTEADEEGNILYLEPYLVTYDREGKEVSRTLLKEEAQRPLMFARMEVAPGGEILIIGEEITVYSKDGSCLRSLALGEKCSVFKSFRADTGIYIQLYDGIQLRSEIRGFDPAKMEFIETKGFTGSEQIVGSGLTTGNSQRPELLLCADSERLYLYDEKNEKMSPLLSWSNCGIQGNSVDFCALWKDGITAVTEENELLFLSLKADGAAQPIQLTLATISKETALSNAVAEFNRSQSEYKMVIKEYGKKTGTAREWQEPMNKMMIDVLGDTPPDLIDIGTAMLPYLSPSADELVAKGYVEDLFPYLQSSEVLREEDFLEESLKYSSFDGKLAAIPRRFTLEALTVSKEDFYAMFGERIGYTVEEMIAYDLAYPELPLIPECSNRDILQLMLYPNTGAFYSLEEGKANFEDPAFRRILEYAGTFPVSQILKLNREGDSLFKYTFLNTILDFQSFLATQYYGGKRTYVGYPSISGEANLNILLKDLLAICSRSRQKEGAWKFLEFYLSYDKDFLKTTTGGLTVEGFPVRKESLKSLLEKASEDTAFNKRTYVVNFPNSTYEYSVHPLTQEERDLFMSLAEHATPLDLTSQRINIIVSEEIDYYFSGQKTLDEVIDVIQNRVSLFLKER